MSPVREMAISDITRRRLLGARQRLTATSRTDDVEAIARSLVALHSTDPVSVYLSVLARMRTPDLNAVADALYVQRSLIRHHAMRTTLWVAPIDTVALMHHACTVKIAGVQRRRTEKFLAESGVADPDAWLDDARDQVSAVLADRGPINSREIGRLLPDVARPLLMAEGKSYAGTQGAHSRVLAGLGFDGIAVRTRPGGSWIGAQYSWALMQQWAPDLHTALSVDPSSMTASCRSGAEARPVHDRESVTRKAQAGLATAWLERFGPGTERDLSWWAGWTLGDTRAALAACGAESVTTQAGPAWMLPGSQVEDEPWVALLPGLDPTVMGWKERGFYLPPGGEAAWDRNGNAGPTVWMDGQVVGAWGQTKDGEIRLRSFVDLPAVRRREIEARAAQVRDWLGETRISWRFPGDVNAELISKG